MGEGNFETSAEKIYASREEALEDLLGADIESFLQNIRQILGKRISRAAFFKNQCMHELPVGTDRTKTYKVGDEDFSAADLLDYLFTLNTKED